MAYLSVRYFITPESFILQTQTISVISKDRTKFEALLALASLVHSVAGAQGFTIDKAKSRHAHLNQTSETNHSFCKNLLGFLTVGPPHITSFILC